MTIRTSSHKKARRIFDQIKNWASGFVVVDVFDDLVKDHPDGTNKTQDDKWLLIKTLSPEWQVLGDTELVSDCTSFGETVCGALVLRRSSFE